MGTTLTGTTPQDTYDSLIKVTDNGPLSGTAKYLSDGLGNDSALALSTGNIGIGTTTLFTKMSIANSLSATSIGTNYNAGILNIQNTNTTNGNLSLIGFQDASASINLAAVGAINTVHSGSPNSVVGELGFYTKASGGGYVTERMRITSAGNVLVGTSSSDLTRNMIVAGTAGMAVQYAGNAGTYFDIAPAAANGAVTLTADARTGAYPDMIFRTSAAEQVRITSGGVLQLTQGQIKFPATQVASADPNTLDDYEEGTWTPAISFGGASVGVTYGLRTATYTKIGRQVTVNGYILLSDKGTSAGTARIGSLPFTISAGAGFYCAASFGALTAITYDGTLQGFGDVNSTNIELNDFTEAGVQSPITNADFSNNSQIIFSLTYFV